MKNWIAVIILLSSSYSLGFNSDSSQLKATQGRSCSAYYTTVGGGGLKVSRVKLAEGVRELEVAGDDRYSLTVKDDRPVLFKTRWGAQVPLSYGGMTPKVGGSVGTFFTSSGLDLVPLDANGRQRYMYVVCK